MQPGFPRRGTAYKHARPAPRRAAGKPPQIADTVTWTRTLGGEGGEPRERYRIVYRDRDDNLSERTVELLQVGTNDGHTIYGVNHAGKFKTLRADRVVTVIESLTLAADGLPCQSIRPAPTYHSRLPPWPVAGAVYPVPQTANPRRTWRVDLNAYTCTCPEKRIRHSKGFEPGQLGHVCLHIARAIQDHLPAERDAAWSPELLEFLQDRKKLHVDSLGK